MAVPKRRTPRARRDQRRSHDALPLPGRSRCPQCGAARAPHRACARCGTYRGREVIATEEA
jgi:large subunit ribosomal protein L32